MFVLLASGFDSRCDYLGDQPKVSRNHVHVECEARHMGLPEVCSQQQPDASCGLPTHLGLGDDESCPTLFQEHRKKLTVPNVLRNVLSKCERFDY